MQCVVWVAISFVLCTWPPIKTLWIGSTTVELHAFNADTSNFNTGISIWGAINSPADDDVLRIITIKTVLFGGFSLNGPG